MSVQTVKIQNIFPLHCKCFYVNTVLHVFSNICREHESRSKDGFVETGGGDTEATKNNLINQNEVNHTGGPDSKGKGEKCMGLIDSDEAFQSFCF